MMLTDRCFSGIPETLIPLYTAKTAHESFEAGLQIIKQADAVTQLSLLRNPAFVRIMQSAIDGLDQCQKVHLESLSAALNPDNQRTFFEVFE